MSDTLSVINRQRRFRVDSRTLRTLARTLTRHLFPDLPLTLGIHLLGPRAMARLNETFLQHEGPTDVITFNHGNPTSSDAVHGEIFLCPAEAADRAPEFHVHWTHELARYLAHGLLHLQGHDDRTPALRRGMRRLEDALLTLPDVRPLLDRLASDTPRP